MVTIYQHPHDEGSIAIESLWSEKTLVQKVPGTLYDRHIKMWKCPLSWASCIALRGVFGSRLKVGDDIAEWAREEHTQRVKPALELRNLLEVESSPYTNGHDEYLYPFQKAGRDFLVTSQDAVLSDEMGCIAGDQKIKVNRAGRTRTYTMRDLYRRFHRQNSGKKWDSDISTKVKSMFEDGTLLLNDIIDVMYRGIQHTITLTMKSGRTLTCTPDHRLSTGVGQWIEAENLTIGDSVMVNGIPVCLECGSTEDIITYSQAKFLGLCKTCAYSKRKHRVGEYGKGRFADKHGYIMLTQYPNHPNADANGNVREHVKVMTDFLGRALKPGEVVHHKDHDKQNNDVSNLELTTQSEHASIHGSQDRFKRLDGGTSNTGGHIWFMAHEDEVVSIEHSSITDVYDIEMKAPAHNFVVNGVVVHNSGKTFQVLAAQRAVEQKEGVESAYPALVVCPNSVKHNWAREVTQWLPEATPIVVEGNATKRRSLIESAKDVERAVVIINYESVRRHSRLAPYGSTRLQRCFDCDRVRGIEGLKPAQCEVHIKELNGFGFRTCVLDEAHRVKDARVKQTRATWAVFHEDTVRHRWALTGTPVANHPGDFWSILHTVAPYEYPRKTAFLDRYAEMSFNAFGGMDITGLHPSTRSEFYQIVEPRFRRMLKQVVLPQLPDKIHTIRSVEMSPKQKKAYTEISKSLVTMLDDGTPMVSSNNLTAAIRLLQLSSAYCEIDKHGINDDPSEWTVNLVGPSPKVDELIALIEENPNKPLAVSADQRKLLELASEELYKRDIDHVMITGAVPESVRNDNIQRFQSGDVNVIMYTYKAGGVGLNMTRADTLVRLQRSWSLIDNRQGEDRVHRIGSEQHDSIHIIDLITSGTIEEHQVRRLYDKMERMEEITRDKQQLAARGLDTSSLDDELMRIESAFLGEG